MFMGYRTRNKILKEMGFSSYEEYRESELWDIIRKKVLSRDACFCRICGKRGYEVHHFTYNEKILRGERPEVLITLCRECHQEIEFQGSKKRSLKDSQRMLLEKVTRTKLVKGVSNPKVGRWFRNQWKTNLPIAAELKEETKHVSLSNM